MVSKVLQQSQVLLSIVPQSSMPLSDIVKLKFAKTASVKVSKEDIYEGMDEVFQTCQTETVRDDTTKDKAGNLLWYLEIRALVNRIFINFIQYNLNGSNTDGSFTVDDSNSFPSL